MTLVDETNKKAASADRASQKLAVSRQEVGLGPGRSMDVADREVRQNKFIYSMPLSVSH